MEKKFQPQDLAALLAQQQGISTEEALNFVRAFFELTEEALVNDSLVKVTGFGTTKLVVVNERESVNIHTGERFQIGKHTRITFTPDNTLRDLVNSPFALLTTTTLYNETPEEELDSVPVATEEYGEEEATEVPSHETVASEVAENFVSPEEEIPMEEDEAPMEEDSVPMNDTPSTEVAEDTQETTTATLPVAPNDERGIQTAAEEPSPEQPEIEPTSSTAMTLPADVAEETADIPNSSSATDYTSTEESHASDEVPEVSLEEAPEIVIAEAPITVEETAEESAEVSINSTSQETPAAPPPTPAEGTLQNVTNIQGEIHVKTEDVGNKAHHHRTRFNILLFAFVLLLLVLTYFAGYYHWLCPNCPQIHTVMSTPAVVANHNTDANATLQTSSPKLDTPATSGENQASSSTASKDSANMTVTSANTTAETTATTSAPTPTVAEKPQKTRRIVLKGNQLTAQEKEGLRAKSRDFQQMPHGKSMIVGTYMTHVVKAGENLPRLSKLYYGSPNYANYIILHNHIDRPDLIKIGQRIKIPQLMQE